jgi:hypothetical protein
MKSLKVATDKRRKFLITKPTILSHDSNFHLHNGTCRDLRWPQNLCTESPNDHLTKFFHHLS